VHGADAGIGCCSVHRSDKDLWQLAVLKGSHEAVELRNAVGP
jgi:hypothetical protein